MSKPEPLLRAKFKQSINLPGVSDAQLGPPTDTWPLRTSIGAVQQVYKCWWEDGWVVIENTQHGTKMRYPGSLLVETKWARDMVAK